MEVCRWSDTQPNSALVNSNVDESDISGGGCTVVVIVCETRAGGIEPGTGLVRAESTRWRTPPSDSNHGRVCVWSTPHTTATATNTQTQHLQQALETCEDSFERPPNNGLPERHETSLVDDTTPVYSRTMPTWLVVKSDLDTGTVQYLILRDEPQALVKVGQRHEVAVNQVNHRLDDPVPLSRFHVANL